MPGLGCDQLGQGSGGVLAQEGHGRQEVTQLLLRQLELLAPFRPFDEEGAQLAGALCQGLLVPVAGSLGRVQTFAQAGAQISR